MTDRKPLTPEEFAKAMQQTSIAADLARIAGLALTGDIAAIRADQAKIEAARLRFKHGKDSAPAAAVTKGAVIRAERATTASAIGTAAQSELRKVLDELAGDKPPPDEKPTDGLKDGFVITGRVLKGSEGVAGAIVEAVTVSKAETIAARATSDRIGAFRLAIENVAELRRKLGLDQNARLAVKLVARSDRETVAQSEGEIIVTAGDQATATLRAAVPIPRSRGGSKSTPRARKP